MQPTRMDSRWSRRLICACLAASSVAPAIALAKPGDPPAPSADADLASKKLLAAAGQFNRGNWKWAEKEYSEFLQQFPTHPEATTARYALGICEYKQREYDKAIELLSAALKDAKFEQRDEALAVIGHSQLSLGKYAPALAAFDELLARFPKSKHAEGAALNRAQVLYLDKQYKEAAAAAEAFARQFPESADRPAGLYFLALSQRAQNQDAGAGESLQALLKQFPKSRYELDATLLLGQVLESQNQLEPAAEQFRRFIAVAPAARQADGHYSLGLLLYKSAKYDDAAKELSAVATDSPDSAYAKPARLQLGLVQLAAGRIAEARKALTDSVKDDPAGAPAARYGLAQCDMAEKKFQPAYDTLGELLKQAPPPANAAQIALDRAVCLTELGKHEQAASEFAAFIERNPKSPQLAEARYRQAFSLHRLGKYAESDALCKQVIASDSKEMASAAAELDAENLFLLARYGDAASAYTALQRGTKDGDRQLRFGLRLGQCAYFAGDYPKAVDLLTPLADNPKVVAGDDLSRGVFLLGDALLQLGKNTEAAAALQKYVALAKPDAKGDRQEAQFKLALAQLRGGNVAAAQKNLADAAAGPADSPWTVRALFESGQLAYKQQPPQLESAAASLTKVLAANPPEELAAPAQYLLGWIDLDTKKFAAAAEKWAALGAKYPKHPLAADAAFQQGVALREAGKPEEALAAFTAYRKAFPEGQYRIKAAQLAAASLTALKRDEEAKQMLATLAADKSASDAVLYDLAWAQKATKDSAGASDTYRRLLKEQPDSKLASAARTELAEMLYADAKYDDATQLLKIAVADKAADPATVGAAMYRLGWCYDRLGKPELAAEAFTAYARSGAKDATVPAALVQAGVSYAALGRFDSAEKSLQEALTKFPEDASANIALLKLGEVQADGGKFDAALATDKQFLEKYPKDPFAFRAQFGVGWSLENLKQYPLAREAYLKVIAATNGETAAHAQFQLGEILLAEGKFEEALPELLKVEDVYAYPKWSARALFEAGRAYEQLKQPEQARRQYTEVGTKYKDAPEAAMAQDRLKAIAG